MAQDSESEPMSGGNNFTQKPTRDFCFILFFNSFLHCKEVCTKEFPERDVWDAETHGVEVGREFFFLSQSSPPKEVFMKDV